jgi:hypothetical protein
VNTDNTTHKPGAGWQILGEFELPAGASVEGALHAWLQEILHPLDLQAELLDKILASAQAAVARVVRTEIIPRFEHLHLTVFIPSEREEKKQAWGFFRLEKIEDMQGEQTDGDHAIEFYLYGEGD